MDIPGPQAQSARVARRSRGEFPGNEAQSLNGIAPTRAGHGGFMKTSCKIKKRALQTWLWGVLWLFALSLMLNAACAAQDAVTEWNLNAEKAILADSSVRTNAVTAARVYAMMHAAIFDAVNGIERRYEPYHVDAATPRGASRRAAAIEAAYTTLVAFFPSQKSTLDGELASSLASLSPGDEGPGESQSIDLGLAWG